MDIQEALLGTLKNHGVKYEYCESIRGYALECINCGNVWTLIPSKRIPVFPAGFGRCPDGQNCKRQEIEPPLLPPTRPTQQTRRTRRKIVHNGKPFEQIESLWTTRDRAKLWLVELPTGELITVAERYPINYLEARKRAREHMARIRLPRGTILFCAG